MISRDRSLDFTCTVCGAAPNEECESNTGHIRFESHAERIEAVYTREFFRKRVVLPITKIGLGEKPFLPPQKVKENWIAKVVLFR